MILILEQLLDRVITGELVYAEAKYANYQADEFFVDVQKVIFGIGYQY
jgi:hypothetical protein